MEQEKAGKEKDAARENRGNQENRGKAGAEENGKNQEERQGEISGAAELLERVRKINERAAMVVREEGVLLSGLKELEEIRKLCRKRGGEPDGRNDRKKTPLHEKPLWERYLESRELEAALILSEALLRAALLRKESRGSHFRADYPKRDENLRRKIVTSFRDGELYTRLI